VWNLEKTFACQITELNERRFVKGSAAGKKIKEEKMRKKKGKGTRASEKKKRKETWKPSIWVRMLEGNFA
jgi:hypothetical protein